MERFAAELLADEVDKSLEIPVDVKSLLETRESVELVKSPRA